VTTGFALERWDARSEKADFLTVAGHWLCNLGKTLPLIFNPLACGLRQLGPCRRRRCAWTSGVRSSRRPQIEESKLATIAPRLSCACASPCAASDRNILNTSHSHRAQQQQLHHRMGPSTSCQRPVAAQLSPSIPVVSLATSS
jgi:hypothetical protein